MIIKVSGIPSVTITGSLYSVDVPVSTYDDNGWTGVSTVLNITGDITDTPQMFWTKLKAKADIWETELGIMETFQIKLAGLVGKIL